MVVLSHTSLWLKGDVEAYKRGTPPSSFGEDGLRDVYLTSVEVCQMTGLGRNALEGGVHQLDAAVRVGRAKLWLRDEVEAWVKERDGGDRRPRGKSDSASK